MVLVIPRRKLSVFFFVYGGLVHLLLFRWYVSYAYAPPSDRSFVNHPATNIAAAVLPGISVSWFMLHLLDQALRTDFKRASSIVLKGGVYGILATVLSLEAFIVLCSVWIALWSGSGYPFWVRLLGIPLAFIDIQTYGMVPISESIPFAFMYGSVGAAIILNLRRRDTQSINAPEKS